MSLSRDQSQILVNSKIAKFLLKVRNTKSRKPDLENAIVDRVTSLEGTSPSRHIYFKD